MPPGWLLAVWGATRAALLAGLPAVLDSGDGVMELTHGWVQEVRAGDSPYHEAGVAYPPLAMLSFLVPGAWVNSPSTFKMTFALAIFAVDLGGLVLASRAERRGRRYAGLAYAVAVPAMGPLLLLWRYDLVPAVMHLGAAAAALRGSRRWSWAWLGLGIAFKPYLAALLPLWAVWEWRAADPERPRRLVEGIALAALPSIIAAAIMLPISGTEFVDSYRFQVTRGLNLESTPAIVLAEAGLAGAEQRAEFASACLCWQRAGPAAGGIGDASTGLVLAALAGLTAWSWRRPDAERLVVASVAAVLVLLLGYRVFSPQFMIWPIPALALLAARPGARAALALTVGAAVLASLEYPWQYGAVIEHTGAGRALLLLRVLATAGALAALLVSAGRRPASATTEAA